jgi:predicted transcriptional regulator
MKKAPTAASVMSKGVKRVRADVTVREAAEFLMRHGISGALVVDAHGKPAGVFSQRDIAAYAQNRFLDLPQVDPKHERAKETGEGIPTTRGFHFTAFDETKVTDVMTAGVITVGPDADLGSIARLMTLWKVHRVFVEEKGEITGVVTSMDVLKWVDQALPSRREKARA